MSWLWVAASVGLILVVPHLIVEVCGFTPGKLAKALLYLPAAATLIALVYAVRTSIPIIYIASNLAFNATICAFLATGAVRVWKRKSTVPRHEMLPFLLLSSVLYLFLLSIGRPARRAPCDPRRRGHRERRHGCVLPLLGGTPRRDGPAGAPVPPPGRPAGLPPRFLDDFAISPREADIIGLLVLGAANREISEKLFISPRTVEAHVYNIYRKCDCRNRVELMNRIQQYRPAP